MRIHSNTKKDYVMNIADRMSKLVNNINSTEHIQNIANEFHSNLRNLKKLWRSQSVSNLDHPDVKEIDEAIEDAIAAASSASKSAARSIYYYRTKGWRGAVKAPKVVKVNLLKAFTLTTIVVGLISKIVSSYKSIRRLFRDTLKVFTEYYDYFDPVNDYVVSANGSLEEFSNLIDYRKFTRQLDKIIDSSDEVVRFALNNEKASLVGDELRRMVSHATEIIEISKEFAGRGIDPEEYTEFLEEIDAMIDAISDAEYDLKVSKHQEFFNIRGYIQGIISDMISLGQAMAD